MAGLALPFVAEALARAGQMEAAASDVQRLAQRIGANPRYRVPYLQAMAVLSRVQGQEQEAAALVEEAASLAERQGLAGELAQLRATPGAMGAASHA